MKIEGDDGYEVNHEETAENLSRMTRLSFREAEIYVLTEIEGFTLKDAAEELDVGYGRISNARSRIREKIREADKTSELSI